MCPNAPAKVNNYGVSALDWQQLALCLAGTRSSQSGLQRSPPTIISSQLGYDVMQAVRIVAYGEPEGLQVVDLPPPEVGLSEVLIDVHVAGVNYPDLLVVRGLYQNLAPLPFSPGKEVAGVVRAVGAAVTNFRPGDRVLTLVENGGYVEQIAAPGILCHLLPDGLSFLDAVGLGLGFQTAHFALFERGSHKAGETVLVTGATGVVGIATIQLAKAHGGRVLAGCMNPAKAAFAREHGADDVILLDRPDLSDALRAEVHAATGGHGADVIVESIGGRVFDACLRSLAWGGRIVVVGFTSVGPSTIRSNYLLIKNIAAIGLHWSDYRDKAPDTVRRAQQNIFELWRNGKIRSPVTAVYPLEQAAAALCRVRERGVLGKIVLVTSRHCVDSTA
jgi:NADPH2:quinone reductase